ncbi:MAG: hypothetical protein V4611_01075 [Patescibacteria group bacterium]
MKNTSWIKKTISVLLVLVASIALFFAQSSYWVNHTVFNQQNFTSIATSAVTAPTSLDAISSQVVDRALQDRPVAQRVLGDRAEKLVASLLGSDFSTQAINKVVGATYKYITTPDRQDIKIELAPITGPISTVLNLAQQGDSNVAQSVESIPDEIVLVESDSFVDLSGVVSMMLWVGPLFWLIALAGFAIYIYIHRDKYAKAVYIVGTSIIIVAILGILARPVLPAPISSMIPVSNLRPVVANVSDAFLAPFQAQMITMLIVTAIALLIFSQRNLIARWVQKLGAMVARESAPAPVKPSTKPAVKTDAKPVAKTTATKTTKKK